MGVERILAGKVFAGATYTVDQQVMLVDFAVGIHRGPEVSPLACVHVHEGPELGYFVISYAVLGGSLIRRHVGQGGVVLGAASIILGIGLGGCVQQTLVLSFIIGPEHDFNITDISALRMGRAVREVMLIQSGQDPLIFCVLWPWSSGKKISIRLSPSYVTLEGEGKDEQIDKLKEWFEHGLKEWDISR